MTDKSKPHYTLVVEATHTTPAQWVYKDSYDKAGRLEPKTKREVARVVLRDTDLPNLLARAAKHLELLEDPEKENTQ